MSHMRQTKLNDQSTNNNRYLYQNDQKKTLSVSRSKLLFAYIILTFDSLIIKSLAFKCS